MFAVGKYNFAEDFEWQNSQNGVAIDVGANNKDYFSITYLEQWFSLGQPNQYLAAPLDVKIGLKFDKSDYWRCSDIITRHPSVPWHPG